MVINKYLAELMGTLILVGLGSLGILAVGGAAGAAEIVAIAFALGSRSSRVSGSSDMSPVPISTRR